MARAQMPADTFRRMVLHIQQRCCDDVTVGVAAGRGATASFVARGSPSGINPSATAIILGVVRVLLGST